MVVFSSGTVLRKIVSCCCAQWFCDRLVMPTRGDEWEMMMEFTFSWFLFLSYIYFILLLLLLIIILVQKVILLTHGDRTHGQKDKLPVFVFWMRKPKPSMIERTGLAGLTEWVRDEPGPDLGLWLSIQAPLMSHDIALWLCAVSVFLHISQATAVCCPWPMRVWIQVDKVFDVFLTMCGGLQRQLRSRYYLNCWRWWQRLS